MKIIQILISTWKGREGDTMEDVLGLGDDGMLYKWHKATGKLILNIINK